MRIHKKQFVVGSLSILACLALVGVAQQARLTTEATHPAADDTRGRDDTYNLHIDAFKRAARLGGEGANEHREEQAERMNENAEITQKDDEDDIVPERCMELSGPRLAYCIFKATGWNK